MVMLSVDVNQGGTDLGQGSGRDGAPVQPGDATPIAANLAVEDEVGGVCVQCWVDADPLTLSSYGEVAPVSDFSEDVGQSKVFEDGPDGDGRLGIQIEDCLDDGPLGPGAHDVRGCASAKDAPDRVDDDRLAGAGFAREDSQARSEPQLGVFKQRKVADRQFLQHERVPSAPVFEGCA